MNITKYITLFTTACALMLMPVQAEAANTIIKKQDIQFDNEWHTFELKAEQSNRHDIEIREAGELSMQFQVFSGMNYVRLFDEDMVKIFDQDLLGTQSAPKTTEIAFDLLPGLYYLQYEYTNKAGEYRVKADFSPAYNNEKEPNDTSAKAMEISMEKPVTGFLTKNLGPASRPSVKVDTADYYSFKVEKDEKIKITYDPEKGNGHFKLFNADMITQRSQTVTKSPYTFEMNMKAGTYYTCISSMNEAGKYTLTVEPSVKPVKKGDTFVDPTTWVQYLVTSTAEGKATASVKELMNKDVISVSIPEAIKVGETTMKITSIGADAFENCASLESIVIGDYVTKIGNRAFSECTALKKVTGGKGVTNIGTKAFYKCTSLTQMGAVKNRITLPSVKLIGKYAFAGCTSVKRVNFSSPNLVRISQAAFKGCKKLSIVNIPSKNLTTIGKECFRSCNALKKVTMRSEKVRVVGKNAFKYVAEKKCQLKVPAAKVKGYKKLFAKANVGTQLKVKKLG